MRILAIRGKNLASLAGEFALELEQEPLASAGLFAITGPTGAGKSTLLDAMCLALFDSVPRLLDSSAAFIGTGQEAEELRLKGNDARTLLRRGASDGYAEVDFLGNDRRRYRARWEVRRARGRHDGRLGKASLSLSELPGGQVLGRTKTEVLAETEQRLGLNFEQFRRAVLLAQGDFAAFLKAKAGERSELLERITGTEIYTHLSKAAHERAKQARTALAEQENRLAALQVLGAAEREALEQERARRRQELAASESLLEHLQQELAWHQRQAELRRAATEAEAALGAAEQARQDAAARRAALDAARRAHAMRHLLEQVGHARDELGQARATLEQARTAAEQARHAVASGQTSLDATQNAWQQAQRAWSELQPQFEQARRLDERLAEAGERLAAAEQARNEAAQHTARAEQAHAALLDAQRQLEAVRHHAETWLAEHAWLAPLAAQWPRWDGELRRYREAAAAWQGAQDELADMSRRLGEAQARLDAAQARERALADEVRAHVEQVRERERDSAAAPSLEALGERRNTLDARRERLRLCLEQARAAQGSADAQRQARAALDNAQAERARLALEWAEAARALPVRQAALGEARAARDALFSAAQTGVADLRAALQDGQPCPVCGASEHPWAHALPPLQGLLAEQQARVAELETGVAALQQAHARLSAEQQHAQRQAEELARQAEQLARQIDALAAAWQAPPEVPAPALFAPELVAQLQARLADNQAALAQARAQENAARRAQDALAQARRDLDARRARQEQARAQAAEHAQALHDLESRAAAVRGREEYARRDRDAALAGLAEALAGIPQGAAELARDAAAFHAACEARVGDWQAQVQAREQAAHGLQEAAGRLALAAAEVRHAQTRQDEAAARCREHAQALADARARRAEVGGGQPLAIWEQAARAALEHAEQTCRQAQAALHAAQQQAAGAAKDLEHAARHHDRQEHLRQLAQARLDTALAEAGLDEAAARAHLARGAAWLEAEHAALDGLRQAVREAEVRLHERRAQAAAHQAARPGTREQAECAAERERLAALCQAARSAYSQAEVRLQEDARRRGQADALRILVEERRQSWRVWESLNEVIGSSDGKAFRNYAQSLTLDLLLAHANRHLRELARRYLLDRAPGSDLELQVVDTEMGDERRGVHSLSGGESFLVSLALALALASLSSQRTQVDSLFIDEGFGSLDGDTLDTALASLDALQSLGRQVGVISHVPAMLERIGVQVRVERRGGGRSVVRVVV